MNRSLAQKPVARQTDYSAGYLALSATVFIWSTPSLFQFYLNRYYDPWAQNFFRYSVACVAVAPFVIYRFRRDGPLLNWRSVGICLIPALPNVVHQVGQTVALHYIGPGVYAIFGRCSVIITALLALAFFPEERWVIRQWRFQVGTTMGLLGAAGVFWFQPGAYRGHLAWQGIAIGFAATLCWALYGILIKRPSAELGAIRSFGLVSLLTSLLLLPLTLTFGKIETPLHVTAHVNLVLIISAVVCISTAHILYYVAIRRIGVALSQSLQLLCPAGAIGLSALIYGERLTAAQMWSGALLLGGAFLAMRVKPPGLTATAENF